MTTLISLTHAGVGYANVTPTDLAAAGVPESAWRPQWLKSYAADMRWRVEVGGIMINGARVPSDDRAKALLTAAAASTTAAAITKVKIGGTFVDLTGAQVKSMRDAVTAHVQACFQAEADVCAAIDDGTITTTAAIDCFGWPPNV